MLRNCVRHCFSKIEKEFLNNPHFDKIYPNLAKHKEPTTIPPQNKESGFLESLRKHYKHGQRDLTENDIEEQNYRRFVEGLESPRGPLKYMSKAEINNVNAQVDKKLQEFEDTGLSKDEILTNGRKRGVPLIQDSFFQYMKKHPEARKLYFQENEEYTVSKVVDLILRQDLGRDTFNNAPHPSIDEQSMPVIRNLKAKPVSRVNPIHNSVGLVNHIVKEDLIYAPLKPHSRRGWRDKNFRRLNNFDIHWRNTEFLVQFLNRSGKIKSKFQTFLDRTQQKKVSREIKKAREMMLLPIGSYIYPHNKRSLTSMEEDVDTHIRIKVNLHSGHLYQEVAPQERTDRNLEEMALRFDYDLSHGESRITEEHIEFIKAQTHADLQKQSGQELPKNSSEAVNKISMLTNTARFAPIRHEDNVKHLLASELNLEGTQNAFKSVSEEIKQVPLERLPQALINEVALDFNGIKGLKVEAPSGKLNRAKSLEIINRIRSSSGLSKLQI